MMKLAILGVIAFVLGLGGTTGVMVMTAPHLAPGADSTAVAHADSTGGGGPAAEHEAAPVAAPGPRPRRLS